MGRTCATYDISVDGQLLREISIDSGEKLAFTNILGTTLKSWDSLGNVTRVETDDLERPTHLWVKKGTEDEALRLFVLYGESYTTPETNNLRGRACLVFDGAGLAESADFDFKGNALSASRKLATVYQSEPDWTLLANSGTPEDALLQASGGASGTGPLLLENTTFSKSFQYDALNRVVSATQPDLSESKPTYNEAGLLEAVDVKIRGASTWTPFVTGSRTMKKGGAPESTTATTLPRSTNTTLSVSG